MSKVPWAISETNNTVVKSDYVVIPILPRKSFYSIFQTFHELLCSKTPRRIMWWFKAVTLVTNYSVGLLEASI